MGVGVVGSYCESNSVEGRAKGREKNIVINSSRKEWYTSLLNVRLAIAIAH